MRTIIAAAALLITAAAHAATDRESARPSFLIPVVGEGAGANGTSFETEVTLSNVRAEAQRVGVYWLPQGSSGDLTEFVAMLTLDASEVKTYPRFVSSIVGRTGLGSIVVRALQPDRQFDSRGLLDGYARVITRSAANVTTSQGIYATSLAPPGADDLQQIAGYVYGLRQDAEHRTNVGMVNLEDAPVTFFVMIRSENIRDTLVVYSVPARSMLQQPLPPLPFGAVTLQVRPVIQPARPFVAWTAYGSSIHNQSGDAWYSKVQMEQ